MRTLATLAAAIGVAGAAAALDLGHQAPIKPAVSYTGPPPARAVVPQGGDNLDDAFIIPSLPFTDTGTTVGYNDDYDQDCPYGVWPTPDVCYLFTPDHDLMLTVDLCGSFYDTKTFIYGPDWEEIACNDDYYFGPPCGLYVSRIDAAPLQAGLSYLICIDGYAGSVGDYVLEIYEYVPCVLAIPDGAVAESGPNDGCNVPAQPFEDLIGDAQGELVFAGVSGWWDSGARDMDWFTATFGPMGVIDVVFTPEVRSSLWEAGPQDCANVQVVDVLDADDCESVAAQVTGVPGSVVWLVVAPDTYSAPDGWPNDDFDYLLEFSGLAPGGVATQTRTWGELKTLYR